MVREGGRNVDPSAVFIPVPVAHQPAQWKCIGYVPKNRNAVRGFPAFIKISHGSSLMPTRFKTPAMSGVLAPGHHGLSAVKHELRADKSPQAAGLPQRPTAQTEPSGEVRFPRKPV